MDQENLSGKKLAWLGLRSVDGIGPVSARRLIDAFGSPEAALRAGPALLRRVEGLSARQVDSFASHGWLEEARQEWSKLRDLGAEISTPDDPDYPTRLREIPDPPLILTRKGTFLPRDTAAVAIVGARRASPFGLSLAEQFGRELAAMGFTVVSGLARGIDAAAHRGAVSAGGRTIGVLGCGIDVAYPREHGPLLAAVAAHGAVMTELPCGTPPDPSNFPQRNRIISGLSMGVVVVEAAPDSGSLITARLALEQGREVFAVPGRPGMPLSKGPHALIRQGAVLVESASEVADALRPQAEGVTLHASPPRPPVTVSLTPAERGVYASLSADPKHIDRVSAELGRPIREVAPILTILEMKGAVRQMDGKRFVSLPVIPAGETGSS
ncbi:MAG: DNA-protecting protein DprA [Nitrospirae bacterium]|nr:DNA-protecting protein DprA [Nitrospirota bacterium]